ncbi:MAG TPA: histidinol dehydrogenase [Solirubrobacteraceae bacterium]
MRHERIVAGADPAALAAELRALVPAPGLVRDQVAEIVAQVRAHGDEALNSYTRRFDTGGAEQPAITVSRNELNTAERDLDPPVRAGLAAAIENVRRVGEAGIVEDRTVRFDHHQVTLRSAPVSRAAVYVPGGRAPYPSTVVMGVVTARVAGVTDVAVCAPPSRDGMVDPVVLAACKLAGATRVYAMGGAQAIAALAYGTESVAPVDVIVGPGNLYVQEAKRQVSGDVGIDGFAGPSDLVVVAAHDADPRPLALDLLAQAEHGDGTLVVAASDSAQLLYAIGEQLDDAPDTNAIVRLVETGNLDDALTLAQSFAPEHLQLAGAAEQLAPRATSAGCLFVGTAAGTAFGDYIAGCNHILPTNGAARFSSGLTAAQFRRTFAEVRLDDADALARAAAPVARAEGFEFHARSMEARIRDNGGDGS